MDGEKRGSGESQETEAEETVTVAISLSPPSRGVTPVVMWIKGQKTGHARPLAACLVMATVPARPAVSAAARTCGTSLSFSQLLN